MLNAASMLGEAGYHVTYVSECASDPVGDMLVAYLERHGVDTNSIDRYSDGITPLNLRFAPDNELVCSRNYPKEKFDFVWPRIDSDDVVVYGAFFSLNERVRSNILELLNYSIERKAITIYVPGLMPVPHNGITKMMPDILENLEMASMVLTRSSDLRTIFNETDSTKCYERHIKFYSDNYFHIDSEDAAVKLQHKDMIISAKKPKLDENLETTASGIAGLVAALVDMDIKLEDLPSLSEADMKNIVKRIADSAYSKKISTAD